MIKGVIFDFNRTVYNPETDKLTEGLLELLIELKDKNYKLALLSKKTRPDRREQITNLGLDEYFIDIQVIEGGKTEENFVQTLNIMGLKSEEVLVVGDRIKSEIVLGNKVGMKTVWYQSGKFATESPEINMEKPDYIIKILKEIKFFL